MYYMGQYYVPDCALMIYKHKLADRVLEFLNRDSNETLNHLTCCRHEPNKYTVQRRDDGFDEYVVYMV